MVARNKAGFYALRETLGISQVDLAAILHLHSDTVRKYEGADARYRPSDDAWSCLEQLRAEQIDRELDIVAEAEALFDGAAEKPPAVRLPLYHSQRHYEGHEGDGGSWSVSNATVLHAAQRLADRRPDIDVEFYYPGEEA